MDVSKSTAVSPVWRSPQGGTSWTSFLNIIQQDTGAWQIRAIKHWECRPFLTLISRDESKGSKAFLSVKKEITDTYKPLLLVVSWPLLLLSCLSLFEQLPLKIPSFFLICNKNAAPTSM